MFEAIASIAKWLFPPDGGDTLALRHWRWSMTVLALLTSISFGTHLVLDWGYIPALYSGVASVEDVQRIVSDNTRQRVTDLQTKILDTREKQCTSPSGQLRQLYTQSLQNLLIEYARLTKLNYPTPACSEF